MKIRFVLGKGGVGKTTVSAAIGVGIAESGKSVFLSSLDPAHNLGDALSVKLSNKATTVNQRLKAVEINTESIIKEYLSEMSQKLKTTYRYLYTMNLDKYFDILKHSPGIEEYAILESIQKTIHTEMADILIFDTPPTGITQKVLALPKLTLIWVERLIKMRKGILSKRQMIKNVRGEYSAVVGDELVELPTEEEKDDIMIELKKYGKELHEIDEILSSQDTTIYIVTLPEELSLFETERILTFMNEFKIHVGGIFLNKVLRIENPPREIAGKIKEQEYVISEMAKRFSGIKITEIPLLESSPRGTKALYKLYKEYIEEGL